MVARPSGSLRQLHVAFLLDQRQHLGLDELRIPRRHRVVLQPALAALRVAAAVANRDRHHRRDALLRDQIVEGGEQQLVRSVRADDERRGACRRRTASARRQSRGACREPDGWWSRRAWQDRRDRRCRTCQLRARCRDRSCCPPSSSSGCRSFPDGTPSCTVISGAGVCVGPRMKFPLTSIGGSVPSGRSFALTNPAVFGSRVGGVGRGAGAACV